MFAALAENLPNLVPGPFPPAAFRGGPRTPSTTLYITTTLLTGETSRFTDSFGTLVQDVDRQGLFTFTETELAQGLAIAPALALAARSSASFPAAFEPSFIPFTKGTSKTKTIPARPAMARFTNVTRPHWVTDGGLLDNRPIGVLVERIFDRPARRPVRRVLLFVVPSSGPAPDLLKQAPPDDVNEPLGLIDGLMKDLAAITTQSIASDLRAIRAHQDRMEARTDTRLRLAELAATLPRRSRLLTTSLLEDYRTREATKQARALTAALLRQLSTWPPAPNMSTESIPTAWEEDLLVGGGAENKCRGTITQSILSHWSLPSPALPQSAADLAQFDQAAYDLAKGSALAVARPAYQLAKSEDDMAALVRLTEAIHRAWEPAQPPDLGELVREVCTDPGVRQEPIENAAELLAKRYLEHYTVNEDAWIRLGRAFVDNDQTLKHLASKVIASSALAVGTGSELDHNQEAARQLNSYLAYLSPAVNEEDVAKLLFDLSVSQRAMLPVEADIEQSLGLVQLSADTRNLLAPDWETAQEKLTGMQFHHFGAFYKRSWRANDWMWGRLDGAGWLVHVLLDPRRVLWVVQSHADEREQGTDNPESGAQWLLRKLKALGAPDFPSSGYRLSASGDGPNEYLTEDMLLDELGFLDDPSKAIPSSIPRTSLWLAQAWQQRVLDEEMNELANAVLDPQPGQKPDWSPASSRTWATKVLAASLGDAKYALLNEETVARETFLSDKGSPLMAHTIAKAAATASGAAGSIRQLPGVIKPPLTTLRTLTLGGYKVVSLTKGLARSIIIAGAVLLVLGIAAAIQSETLFGVTGLIMAGVGGYLIVLGTWQLSSRALFALLSATLVGAVFALATPVVREWLFGTQSDPGLVGTNAYWLGAQWWHPLIVVGAIALTATAIAAAMPSRKPPNR